MSFSNIIEIIEKRIRKFFDVCNKKPSESLRTEMNSYQFMYILSHKDYLSMNFFSDFIVIS